MIPQLSGAPVFVPDFRRAIRSEPNPFDKATIFSVYPQEILDNTKVTIQPNRFLIPAGSYETPGRLVVGPASWWRDVDPEQPLLEIPVSSVQLADSIVKDYCNSRIGANASDSGPGLFYVPGDISLATLKKDFAHILVAAITKQKAWYKELVKLGDALWARTNGNPIAIDDTMRLAAKELGMTREWIAQFKALDMIACVACGNMRNPNFPICSTCKAIVDPVKAKELGLTFAQ